MKKSQPAPVPELPPDVKPADLKYTFSPGWERPPDLPYSITFYNTWSLGWVLCTLHIANPSRRQRSRSPETEARTYAITLKDSKVCRVGLGPHVTAKVEVHLNAENKDRLSKYVDLYNKGLGDARSIRDRISTRRAQGQLYRQQGRTSWMW